MGKGNANEIASGGVLVAIGLFFLVGAFEYPLGTAQRMGPGYFPVVLGALAIALGVLIPLVGWRRTHPLPRVEWRPLAAVLAGISTFGVLMTYFGLAPAIFLAVILAALGDRSSRPTSMLLLAVGVSLSTWLIFSVALGLALPILKLPE